MAEIIGRDFDVAVSAAGSSYTEIANIQSVTLSKNQDVADITNNDSAGAKESLKADYQYSAKIDVVYDPADSGQDLLMTGSEASTAYYFRFRPKALATVDEFIFQGWITSMEWSGSTGEGEMLSVSIESTGAVTRSAQS